MEGGGGGGGMLPDFLFCSLFPVQQTTSGIGRKLFFRVGNQYAECEKQQLLNNSTFQPCPHEAELIRSDGFCDGISGWVIMLSGGCSEGLDAFRFVF